MGLVYLPKGNQLAEILLDQLMKFPSGRYDDGVDACSAFGRLIDKVWEQSPPKPKEEPQMITDHGPGPYVNEKNELVMNFEEFFTKDKHSWM